MKIINIFCFLSISINILSQGTTTQSEIVNDCNCEILIYTEPILGPGLPPDLGPPTVDGHIEGDLNEFSKYIDGECYRTVHVIKRKIVNNQISYRTITMANDINALLQTYPNNRSFCFKGTFRFNNTITVERNKILKLLDNTSLKYFGDGHTPAISFEGSRSGIEGGTITTKVPMNDGLIKIISEGLNDVTDIHIHDISLVNTDNTIYTPNADARNDRAINMTNPFESLVTQRDRSTNYYAKITDVDITGFAVGMHLRGWSNGASVRDVTFTDIHAYGIWVSGCVDNSFSNLSFIACYNARAIRLDNYIDERFNGGNIGPIQLSLNDPNQRVEFETLDLLSNLINPLNGSQIPSQQAFNISVDNLLDIDIDNDPAYFFGIFEACANGSEINDNSFSNLFANGSISKLGLMDLAEDDPNGIAGYPPDGLDISSTLLDLNRSLSGDPFPNRISLYRSKFNHEDPMFGEINLLEPTCNTSAGFSMFFRRPSFNAFSEIDYVISDEGGIGISQVQALVEVQGREDDEDLCMEKSSGLPCDNCEYDQTDKNGIVNPNRMASGFENTINVCEEPDDPSFVHLINNTENTDVPKDACDLDKVVIFFGIDNIVEEK